MPTEHEYKYVLDVQTDESYFIDNCKTHYRIQQGYIAFSKGMTCRVRCATQLDSDPKWYYTFKQKVGDRIIEIEKKIDERDGEDLWSVCMNKLTKNRYVLKSKKVDWEIDFFGENSGRYFVLAEVELEEGSSRIGLPNFIKKWLKYEVPLTDDRFANKRLGDLDYASRVYQQLLNGDKDVYSNEKEN